MSHTDHKRQSAAITARCAIVTLSDTRSEADDRSGQAIRRLLTEAGHAVGFYRVVPDEPIPLDMLLAELIDNPEIDVVITSGGTGISPRDNTVPVIARHISTALPGFGELFRMLSFQEIGSAAMLSRALGGIAGGKPLFALPGSPGAVELAMTRLILPEIGHLLRELRKQT